MYFVGKYISYMEGGEELQRGIFKFSLARNRFVCRYEKNCIQISTDSAWIIFSRRSPPVLAVICLSYAILCQLSVVAITTHCTQRQSSDTVAEA
jgi:hypothetical protein